jgi:uncharacterized protein (TIGR00725 family)
MSHRLPIVGVMGSGTVAHEARSVPLGRELARRDVHLLTGGGGGVMAAVSRSFHETPGRRGLVIGILPAAEDSMSPRAGYPNPWVEVSIRTHLPLTGEHGTEPLSRNHINVLTADLVIALPGGAGTASEVTLARAYGKPITAFLDAPDEIPHLAVDVPVLHSLEAVLAFVDGARRVIG